MPLGSPFYIQRPPVEELVYKEIVKPGSVIRIKAPRKMGKSSLMLRILERAVFLGYRTVALDFQQAEEGVFDSLDKVLRWCPRLRQPAAKAGTGTGRLLG